MCAANTGESAVPAHHSWDATWAAWLDEVRGRSGSVRTPVEYARYLRQLLPADLDPRAITSADVHLLAYAPAEGHEPAGSTVNVRLAAIRSAFDFLIRHGLVATNPADPVKRGKPAKPVPRGLDSDELRRLLAAIPATAAGARDRALIVTAILTGLRRTEVLSLRAGDLSEEHGAVYFHVRVKGGRQRRRRLPDPAYRAIVEGLTANGRTLATAGRREPLFPLSARGFAANLARYARHAGLSGVSPHTLRHSAAKLRLRTGASVEDIKALLGHSSITTTARYLTSLEGEEDATWAGAAIAIGLAVA